MTGTHNDDEVEANRTDSINLLRVRMPKLHQSEKSTIDYTGLDRETHSKTQMVKRIPHEGEVLKCRQNPLD